jgi:hypothetical protein
MLAQVLLPGRDAEDSDKAVRAASTWSWNPVGAFRIRSVSGRRGKMDRNHGETVRRAVTVTEGDPHNPMSTVLGGLFSYVAVVHSPAELTVDDADVLPVAVYLGVYLVTFMGYNVDLAHLCWRYARVAKDRPWLWRGLLLTTAGYGCST